MQKVMALVKTDKMYKKQLKRKPTVNCKNFVYVCACHCAQLL